MEITVNGLRVRYIDQGSGQHTVLLLHGWGVDAGVYHLIIDHLSSYCRVVAPDLPGFGGSEEPPCAWNTAQYGDFVLEFCKQLGITEAVLMGHSNGGRISIELMARPPLPLAVRKAVLIDSAGIPAKHSPSYYVRVYTFKALKAIASLPVVRHLCPDMVEKARRRFGSADYGKASPVMRQSMVMALGLDCRPMLSKITASTLLIWGDKDTATPLSDGQEMEKRIRDAGLVVLSGGHYAFAEQFPRCARVLDAFLKE